MEAWLKAGQFFTAFLLGGIGFLKVTSYYYPVWIAFYKVRKIRMIDPVEKFYF